MKIEINFEHPYMDAKTIEELTIADLDCFYADADEVSSLNLFLFWRHRCTDCTAKKIEKRLHGVRF